MTAELSDGEDEMGRGNGEPIRVMTVDDHPTYAHGLKTLLSALADDIVVVGVATSGAEALDLIAQKCPDVVLMDVRMPQLDGIEVARKVHQLFPDVKVVMLTVSEDARDVHAAITSGLHGYLSKDVDPDQLIAAIRAVHSGEIVLAPFAASVSFSDSGTVAPLSDAEVHLLRLLSQGHDYVGVARELAVSESTVKRMVHEVQRKLGAENRIQALVIAAKRGIV